jgi:putative peptidoglycan lipid II flippase
VFSILSGLAVVIVYTAVAVALDRPDARALLRRGVPTVVEETS